MIARIDITGVHYKVDDKLKKYIGQKIGKLDIYIPVKSRSSSYVEVKLQQNTNKNKHQHYCEIILHLPDSKLTVHESNTTMEAAVDIAEEKLKVQIRKYKDKHDAGRRRHLFKRLFR